MIKLIDLLELEKPANIYAPGFDEEDTNDDFIKKGYRTKTTSINPETGTVSSDVEYLPTFEEIRKKMIQFRKEFQPFRYYDNPNISKLAKEINTSLTKISNSIFALDKMIELEQKRK